MTRPGNRVLRRLRSAAGFLKKMRLDEITAFSAQAAFFLVLSLFPFTMMLASMVSAMPVLSRGIMGETFRGWIPEVFLNFIFSIFPENAGIGGSGGMIAVTSVAALWSASRGVVALVRGLNRVCAAEETRSYPYVRIMACLYTLGFLLSVVLVAVLLVFGQNIAVAVASLIPRARGLVQVIYSLRVLISFALLVVLFLVLYRFLPNRRTTLRREWLGAFAAAAGWVIFSDLYAWYMEHFAAGTFYGSMTTVALFLLWIYVGMYIFFVGAELNTFRDRGQSVREFFGSNREKTPESDGTK